MRVWLAVSKHGQNVSRTNGCVSENDQGVDIVDPFDPETPFVIFVISKDGLYIPRLQPDISPRRLMSVLSGKIREMENAGDSC